MEPEDVIQHTSSEFARFLKNVRSHTLEMGGLAEQHVSSAVQAFLDGNQKLAKKIAREDFKINALEVKIDEECSEFLALQHPVAMDLRTVIAVIKATTDLERVGDEAEKIARMTMQLDYQAVRKRHLRAVKHIARHVLDMLRKSLDSFARLDPEQALEVLKADAEVDQEYEAAIRQMITFMMEDPHDIRLVLEILWCAKALERIGDHAANICEHVLYQVLGKDLRHISIEQVEKELAEAQI
ncbi:MAG: phosphate signaling complex protein PhoU [Gammaproteobacteria bacterium]|nr:phosphate signaling complex protein PhoU [Gammaproteobacteria bacterium]